MGEASALRWSLGYLRPYRGSAVALGALATLEIALRILAPIALMLTIDHALGTAPLTGVLAAVLPHSRAHLLISLVALGTALQIAHQLAVWGYGRISVRIGQGMIRDVREQLFAHVQAWRLASHGEATSGEVVQRLDVDTRCVEQIGLRGLFPVAFSALTLLAMFGVLLSIDARLALLSLAVVPPLYLWLRVTQKFWAPHADRARTSDSRLTSRLVEAVAAIRLIKSHAREAHEQARFARSVNESARAYVQLGHHGATFAIVTGVLTVLGTSAVLLFGGLAVLEGRATLGTLLLVLAYLGNVYGPLSAIASTANDLRIAFASARRVRAAFAIAAERHDTATWPSKVRGEIRFTGVEFAYKPGSPVLRGIDLEAHPGEMIALVGPSGAGKSTLASLLVRFDDPAHGRIEIDGVKLDRYPLRVLRESIALVLQEAFVMTGSVRDNLRYGRLDATDVQIESAARAANAHDFIARLPHGYATMLGDGGARLSVGERQRLSIARAFLKDAPILILDEPTAALDGITERQVVDAVRRLCTGRTTLVIAHRLSTVRDATRIAVLDQGRISALGTHAELLATSPLYQQLAAELARG